MQTAGEVPDREAPTGLTVAQTAARDRLTAQYGQPSALFYELTERVLRLVWWPPTEDVDSGQEIFIRADGRAYAWDRLA